MIGANTRRRILFAAFLAAALWLALKSPGWLGGWLSGKSIDELHRILHWALVLVTVGVLIEEWKLIEKSAKFVRYSFSGRFREAVSKARKHRDELVEGIGFAILIIGLAAELAIDPVIELSEKTTAAKAEGELQTQKVVAANANKAAGEANQKAGEAKERAASAERLLSDANQKAADANAKAESFRLRIADANKAAAKASLDAETARREEERLKASVTWRAISPQGIERVASILSRSRGGSVALIYVEVDPEAIAFTAQLMRIFDRANEIAKTALWTVRPGPRIYSDRVIFSLHMPDMHTAASWDIRQAFALALIPFDSEDVPDVAVTIGMISIGTSSISGDARIIVGSKPPRY